MKKRIWSMLLVLCMALSLLPFGVSADGTPVGENLTWSQGSDDLHHIDGKGEMYDFEDGEQPWANISKLRYVVVSEGVTRIGANAFRGKDLGGISLPLTLKSIGDYAFYESSLPSIMIPGKVEQIGAFAFAGCRELTSAELSKGVTSISESMFAGDRSLWKLKIPVTLERIEADAFLDCDNLRDVRYAGTCEQWEAIEIVGESPALSEAVIHCKDGDLNVKPEETEPPAPEETEPPMPEEQVSFTDVPDTAYYAQAVSWAVANGVTNGTGDNKFSPESPCTRGQIVTFLWRAAGEPKPESTKNPFKDVKKGAYYYDAVLWAVEQGITNGTGEKTFSPSAYCTRGQVVTFLYRNAGSPEIKAKNPFGDVKAGAYFYDAVQWAVKHKITNGTGDKTFSPERTCTRGQIVTFLYRDAAHNAS